MSDATLYIGSVTRGSPYFPDARGAGISTLHWDGTAGALQLLRVTAGYDNPSWLLVDAGNRRLYATSEVAAWNEGLVIGYAIEPDGRLTHRGVVAAGWRAACRRQLCDPALRNAARRRPGDHRRRRHEPAGAGAHAASHAIGASAPGTIPPPLRPLPR